MHDDIDDSSRWSKIHLIANCSWSGWHFKHSKGYSWNRKEPSMFCEAFVAAVVLVAFAGNLGNFTEVWCGVVWWGLLIRTTYNSHDF